MRTNQRLAKPKTEHASLAARLRASEQAQENLRQELQALQAGAARRDAFDDEWDRQER